MFGKVKDHGHTRSFILIILFDGAFKTDEGTKFLGYVGANTETFCVEV
jgi:hypothetical protein